MQLSSLTDEQLVDHVRTKNRETFSYLIRRYEQKLRRYATYLVNDEELAHDAVQQSFIKAFINLNSFDSKKKFSSWLYRIVHNEAMSLVRKHKIHQTLETVFAVAADQNIEDDFVKQELTSNLHDCVSQIPMMYKEPLTLFYLENKSYEEISDILHIPVGTVGTRINRAKKMVKAVCQKKQ